MEFVDILAKLREYEKQGHSVGDAIKGAEMTQPKVDEVGGMSDVHIGAQEHIGNYVDDNGDLKMPKADVMKAMASEKLKATFPQSYEIETAMKMVDEKFDDMGKAVEETVEPTVEPTVETKAKPDFLDMDKDGNKTEPMKKAVKDKEMKKETVKEAIQMSADTPEEGNMLMQILKLAGVRPVDAKMLGMEPEQDMEPKHDMDHGDDAMGNMQMAKMRDMMVVPQEEKTAETFANEPEEKVQDTDTLVNFHSGGLNRQKSQVAKGHPGDNELAAEDLANSLTAQYESFKKTYQAEAKKQSPYAIGMAQAMKSTGDKPPLEKSTIKKAHGIADKIKSKK